MPRSFKGMPEECVIGNEENFTPAADHVPEKPLPAVCEQPLKDLPRLLSRRRRGHLRNRRAKSGVGKAGLRAASSDRAFVPARLKIGLATAAPISFK